MNLTLKQTCAIQVLCQLMTNFLMRKCIIKSPQTSSQVVIITRSNGNTDKALHWNLNENRKKSSIVQKNVRRLLLQSSQFASVSVLS